MSKIYDNAFKIGALFALTVFVSINYRRFEAAYARYQESLNSEIQFAPALSLGLWGWPFNWQDDIGVNVGGGAIVNFLTLAALIFACGFLFRQIWLKWYSKKNGTRIGTDQADWRG